MGTDEEPPLFDSEAGVSLFRGHLLVFFFFWGGGVASSL